MNPEAEAAIAASAPTTFTPALAAATRDSARISRDVQHALARGHTCVVHQDLRRGRKRASDRLVVPARPHPALRRVELVEVHSPVAYDALEWLSS